MKDLDPNFQSEGFDIYTLSLEIKNFVTCRKSSGTEATAENELDVRRHIVLRHEK